MVIQLSVLVAVHGQPESAITLMLPVAEVDAGFTLVAERIARYSGSGLCFSLAAVVPGGQAFVSHSSAKFGY